MEAQLFSAQPLLEALGKTLIHSLWIGTLIVLLCWGIIRFSRSAGPKFEVSVLLSGLASLILTAAALFVYFVTSHPVDVGAAHTPVTGIFTNGIPLSGSANSDVWQLLTASPSFVAMLWMIGAAFLALRMIFNISALYYIKNNAVYDSPSWFVRLLDSIPNLEKSIRFGYSKWIDAPITLGWIKPVVLFPVGLLNQLDVREAEAIVAHELAHIMRKDFLYNMILVSAEILFYFHPGVWWMTHQVRKCREEACDDLAMQMTDDKTGYIKTLVKLQEVQIKRKHDLALAVKSDSSKFYSRIKRLLNMDIESKNRRGQLLIVTSILLLAVFIFQDNLSAHANPFAKSTEPSGKKELVEWVVKTPSDKDAVAKIEKKIRMAEVDTLPQGKIVKKRIVEIENEKEVELEMENGEVTKLKIDGREVPKKEYKEHDKIIKKYKDKGEKDLWFGEGGNAFFFEFDDKDMNERLKRFELDLAHPEKFLNGELAERFNHRFYFDVDSLMKSRDSLLAFHFKGDYPAAIFRHEGWGDEGFPQIFEFKMDDLNKRFQDQLRHYENFENFGPNLWMEQRDYPFPADSELHFYPRGEKNLESIIGNQLNKDGFLIPDRENTVELTGKYLKINGEKQPTNIWNKYKNLFENETGVPLHKKSRLSFSIIGQHSNKRYKAF